MTFNVHRTFATCLVQMMTTTIIEEEEHYRNMLAEDDFSRARGGDAQSVPRLIGYVAPLGRCTDADVGGSFARWPA